MSDRPTFTVAALAQRWECSETAVRRMIKREELQSFRIGALIRIPLAAVEAHECQNLIPSSDEATTMSSNIQMPQSRPAIGREGSPRLTGKAPRPRLVNFGQGQAMASGRSGE